MRKFLFGLLTFLSGLFGLKWASDTWNSQFEKVEVSPVKLKNKAGAEVWGRRVVVQSLWSAPREVVWEKVQTPDLLSYVAWPLLSFAPRDGGSLPQEWQVGETAELTLRGLTLIPLGHHNITLTEQNPDKHILRTQESGHLASVWNHDIYVEAVGAAETRYTDAIEIYAGPLTPFIAFFAWIFYRHRQTRWRQVLNLS